ncbi:MAG: hypothetical protein ACJ8DI_11595 [Ktedonobacteraceae bacterium]
MTSILGLWQVNANDSEGALRLFLNNQGNLQGKITFQDARRIDDLTNISWSDAAGEISFVRNLGQSGVAQTYTGFLGDGHANQFLYLAGFFTESDIPSGASRTQYGWFARQPQPATQYVVISDPFNNSPFHIFVPATDLNKSHPIVHGGPYSADAFSLQPPLTIQWTAEQPTTIMSPTTASTAINFDLTGNLDGRDFQVSVQVTDQLGAAASDQKTVSIDVIGSKGGTS